jgi:hypothetical protein
MTDPVLPAVPANFRPLKVGDGHGFVVEAGHRRLVITAAHCLPGLSWEWCSSSSDAFAFPGTYEALLGMFDHAVPTVATQCLFVDPAGDIAVLGSYDNAVSWERADAYNALVEGAGRAAGQRSARQL